MMIGTHRDVVKPFPRIFYIFPIPVDQISYKVSYASSCGSYKKSTPGINTFSISPAYLGYKPAHLRLFFIIANVCTQESSHLPRLDRLNWNSGQECCSQD